MAPSSSDECNCRRCRRDERRKCRRRGRRRKRKTKRAELIEKERERLVRETPAAASVCEGGGDLARRLFALTVIRPDQIELALERLASDEAFCAARPSYKSNTVMVGIHDCLGILEGERGDFTHEARLQLAVSAWRDLIFDFLASIATCKDTTNFSDWMFCRVDDITLRNLEFQEICEVSLASDDVDARLQEQFTVNWFAYAKPAIDLRLFAACVAVRSISIELVLMDTDEAKRTVINSLLVSSK